MLLYATSLLPFIRIFLVTHFVIVTIVTLECADSQYTKNNTVNNGKLQSTNNYISINVFESLISRRSSKARADGVRHTLENGSGNTPGTLHKMDSTSPYIKDNFAEAEIAEIHLQSKRRNGVRFSRSAEDFYAQSPTSVNMTKIKIAILLPFDDQRLFSIYRVVPAIEIAIEKVNPMLAERNHTLVMKYRDSNCDSADGINEAINFYVHKEMDVLFGPCCDYAAAPCARQTRYWNIPMITAGALAGDFGHSKTTTMTTLIRMGTNFNALVLFLLKLLEYYDWKKVNVLYDPNGQQEIISKLCHIAADGIHYGLKRQEEEENFTNKYEKFEDREIFTRLPEKIGHNCASKYLFIFDLLHTN